MYQGKRSQSRKLSKLQKYLLLGALLVLALAVSIGFTAAFLIDNDNSVTNTFEAGQVSCQIDEVVGNGVKSSVTVQNTGNVPAYIRVAVVANRVDGDGNIVAGSATASFNLGDGWTHNNDDGYYYCTTPVAPGASTGNLLKSSIDLTGIQVTILAEAIQADGKTGDTPAVVDAWGVDPTDLGGGNG